MKVIAGTRDFQIKDPTVVTIGKFDGRHKGHQKLLREMLGFRERKGYKTAVFTFDMAPAKVVSGTRQQMITTNQERRRNMEPAYAKGISLAGNRYFAQKRLVLCGRKF